MEIKVGCGCGQNYKFDVEPLNGRMPVKVACPGCGADGTESANHFLTQQFPNPSPPVPVALRINRPAEAPPVAVPPVMLSMPDTVAQRPAPAVRTAVSKPKKSEEFNFGLGILGAFLGAFLGAGLVYGFYLWTHFQMPLVGTCIGALTGWGARTLAKGTESVMGGIAGLIALIATFAVLYLMYGGLAVAFLITLAVSVYFAYRIAG